MVVLPDLLAADAEAEEAVEETGGEAMRWAWVEMMEVRVSGSMIYDGWCRAAGLKMRGGFSFVGRKKFK